MMSTYRLLHEEMDDAGCRQFGIYFQILRP